MGPGTLSLSPPRHWNPAAWEWPGEGRVAVCTYTQYEPQLRQNEHVHRDARISREGRVERIRHNYVEIGVDVG
jgi:hypothetical protein